MTDTTIPVPGPGPGPGPRAAGTPFPFDLGPYRVQGELGRGGMAIVLAATQRELGREVALKLLAPDVAADPEGRARFLREGRAAAALQHRSIVQVYDVGEVEGRPYIAMERIDGRALDEHIKELGPLPAPRAALWARQIAEALDHAHRARWIHRDVKPANILITAEQQAKLADFGLAKDFTGTQGLTVSGAVLGTPHYMSPEQLAGDQRRIDGRSDIYSLGASLYQMLTGALPFDGQDVAELVLAIHQREPKPPRQILPGIPGELELICLKAMSKDPARRYDTAADLAADLTRFLQGESIQAKAPTSLRRLGDDLERRPWRYAGLALVASLPLALALGWALQEWELRQVAAQARRTEQQELREAQEGLREWADALGDQGPSAARRELMRLYDRGLAEGDLKAEESQAALAAMADDLAFCPDFYRLRAALGCGRFADLALWDHHPQQLPLELHLNTVERDLSGVLSDISAWADLEPRQPLALLARAWLHLSIRHDRAARADLDAALALDPGQIAARRLRGRMRFSAGDRPGAEQDFEGVAQPLERGLLLLARSRWSEAAAELARAEQGGTPAVERQHARWLRAALLARSDDQDGLRTLWRQGMGEALAPGFGWGPALDDLRQAFQTGEVDTGRLAALAHLDTILLSSPEARAALGGPPPDLRGERGLAGAFHALSHHARPGSLARMLTSALDVFLDDPEVRAALARQAELTGTPGGLNDPLNLLRYAVRWEEGKLLRRHIQERPGGRPDPPVGLALRRAGHAYIRGDLSAAREILRDALPQESGRADFHYALAKVLAANATPRQERPGGRPEDVSSALVHLAEALRLGFAHPDWPARDPDFAALREHPRFRELIGR